MRPFIPSCTRGFLAVLALAVLAAAGPAFAQTPAVVSAASPGVVLSSTQTTATVPVTISRDGNTALLGFSIRIQLSSELSSLNTGSDLAIGAFMTDGPRQTEFHVTPDPVLPRVYTVDGVVLGADCGPVAQSGTLFTLTVRSTAATGTGTVTIQSVTLRDCENATVPSSIGTAASVAIDNSAPSVAVTSPNGGETFVYQTTRNITWTASDLGGTVTSVDLDYSADAGVHWTAIVTGEANDGTYAWAVPNDPTIGALVRVTAHDSNGNSAADASDAVFTTLSNTAPVLVRPITDKLVDELGTLQFTVGANDGESPPQALTYTLIDGPPAGASIDPVTGVFSWTPTEAQGPDHLTLRVRVTDDGTPNLHDQQTFIVDVAEVNVAPTLLGVPASATIPELSAYGFTASATDPDLPTNPLTYSLVGAPAGASIHPTTGAFLWMPGEDQGPGDYTFAVRVTDQVVNVDAPITLHVTEANVAPQLTGVPSGQIDIPELAPYTFTANGFDSDLPAQTLTFSLVGAPAGAAIDPVTGVFTWTPTEAQGPADHSFTVRLNDGFTDTDAPVTLSVNEVNIAPSAGGVPSSATIPELVEYSFTATASDPDLPANTLVFSLVDPPAGASIGASSGVFTWTPTEVQGPGVFGFGVRVSDSTTNVDTPITLTVADANVAPVLTGVPAVTVAIPELAAYTFDADATDPDVPVQTLSFSLLGAPAGASIDGSTGVFTWTPTEAQSSASDYTFTVRASDGLANTDAAVTLHVDEVNVAPTLSGVPAAPTIPELVAYTFTATATDADLPANTLTFSLVGAPAGAAIDGSTGVFTWTPTEAQGPGSYPFSVRVGDGTTFTSEPITIAVTDANAAPVLADVPTGTVAIPELAAYSFDASASDEDLPAQTLTFSLVGEPAGASIDPGTGVFSWTPSEAQGNNSDYTFTVRVSDGAANTDASVTLHVTEANVAPALADVPPTATIPELVAYTFTATATDPDLPANTLVFSLVGEPSGAAISPSGVFTWTPTEAQGPGTYPFSVRVSDGTSQTDAPIEITVSEVSIAAIADLGASIVRSGNDGDGTTKVLLNWTPTPGGTTVAVYRARFGGYPRYDEDGGAPPATPAAPPASPWELTAVTAPGQADEVSNGATGFAGRDYWYYVAFVSGAGANVSGPSNVPARPNYLLGDVSDGLPGGLGRGNNAVTLADISSLGDSYGITGSALDAGLGVRYLDVGPTSDHSVNGRPMTDSALDFEDLVIFALNFGAGPVAQMAMTPRGGSAGAKFGEDRLLLEAPEAVVAGQEFAVQLRLEGTGRVQALSAALDWNPAEVQPLDVAAGDWLAALQGVAFSPRPGAADVALLGERGAGFEGEGVVAVMRFRAVAACRPHVTLAAVKARDGANQAVAVGAGVLGAGQPKPVATMLAPAFPNPFRGSATVAFSLARTGPVTVAVFGVDGRRVRVLANGPTEAGNYRLEWDGRDDQGQPMSAGIYFVRMTSVDGSHTKRITYLR